MKKILFSLILIFTILVNAFAQTGTLKGRVLEVDSNSSVPYANVYIIKNGKPLATVTDNSGNYILTNLDNGIYTLYVSFVGYNKVSITNIKIDSNNTVYLKDVVLKPYILIDMGDYWYEDGLINEEYDVIIRSKELEKLPEKRNIQEVINTITPGANVSDNGDQISFRGSRNGGIAYYIDGIKTRNSRIGIPFSAIDNLKIFIGGVPAKYGDFDGGVVIIETKDYNNK